MMVLSPDEVCRELLERGCALRSSETAASIRRLEHVIGSELTPYAKAMYEKFDGFIENTSDELTQLSLWSIDEMLKFRDENKNESRFIVFGDRFIHSDFLTSALADREGPVVLLESGEKIASSYEIFWYKWLNSEYDLSGR